MNRFAIPLVPSTHILMLFERVEKEEKIYTDVIRACGKDLSVPRKNTEIHIGQHSQMTWKPSEHRRNAAKTQF